MEQFICTSCGRTIEHPKEPSICDYWFIDGKFVCLLCQREQMHQECQDHVDKISKQLFG